MPSRWPRLQFGTLSPIFFLPMRWTHQRLLAVITVRMPVEFRDLTARSTEPVGYANYGATVARLQLVAREG